MSYTKYVYQRVNWVNKSEALTTPLGKTNLNRMDSAIYNLAENLDIAYTELDAKKINESTADSFLNGLPTWDKDTGVLTFTTYDGTSFSVDFNIEKIPVKFSMDSAGVITMETADGTKWTASIGDAIPTYTFTDSDTIAFSDTKNGDYAHTVTASVKKNSIKSEHLQPDYLADITNQANLAESYKTQSANSADDSHFNALLAQSYAIGGSGIRQGEDTDSSQHYSEVAKNFAEMAENLVDFKMPTFNIDTSNMHLYGDFDKTLVFTLGEDGHLYTDVKASQKGE